MTPQEKLKIQQHIEHLIVYSPEGTFLIFEGGLVYRKVEDRGYPYWVIGSMGVNGYFTPQHDVCTIVEAAQFDDEYWSLS